MFHNTQFPNYVQKKAPVRHTPGLRFFILPMKMRQAVWFFVGVNLLGAMSASGSGIAYFAHLGGGLFGFLYLKSEWIRHKIVWLSSIWRSGKARTTRRSRPRGDDLEVDRILDKISKYGIDSLTRAEKAILERKSRQD